jgi:tRNA(Ile)-lysidine synthase
MAYPGRVADSLGGPGFAVVEAARDAIVHHRMLDPGNTVVLGVSGGPDSLCLLDVMARLATQDDYELVVCHVDHALSDRSESVSTRVAKIAAEAGFDVHVARAHDLAGPNLHARARDFRYGFFETIASDVGAAKIATGHTLDDRVETTIARLVHGASTEGLAGIPPAAGNRIRPLIGVRRAETRAYCEERALEFFDDPSNDDGRFDRAVIRADLIPAIERRWGEGATRAMAEAADRLRDDADALTYLADRLYKDIGRAADDGSLMIDRSLLTEMPRALRRRVLERAVGRVRDRSGGIEAALSALDRGSSSQRFAVASGIEIALEATKVRVSRMPE